MQEVGDVARQACRIVLRIACIESHIHNWELTNEVVRWVGVMQPHMALGHFLRPIVALVGLSGHELHHHPNGVHLICYKCGRLEPSKKKLLPWTCEPCIGSTAPLSRVGIHLLPPIGPIQKVQGLAASLRVFLNGWQKEHKERCKQAGVVLQQDIDSFIQMLPRVYYPPVEGILASRAGAVASQLKPWMLKLSKTHRLFTVGGCAFCDLCNAVVCSERDSRLSRPCIPTYQNRYRITRLKKGHCPDWLSSWPNGAPKGTVLVPKRFKSLG